MEINQAIIRVTTTPHAESLLTEADRRAIFKSCARELNGIKEYPTVADAIEASMERSWAMMAMLKLLVVDENFTEHEIGDVYQMTACIARNAEAWRSELKEYMDAGLPWPPVREGAGIIQGSAGGTSKTDMVARG